MYHVYILRNRHDQTLYKGYTENINDRVESHNKGLVFTTAKKNGDYDLVWHGSFETKLLALRFEKYIKSGSGVAFTNKHLIQKTK